MNLKTIHIEVAPDEIQKLLAIAMDDDRDEALAFIKQHLVKRVEKALQRH